MRILGIETSCDDTGAAVWDSKHGLLCHQLYSQIETHREYGGVVPELAARDHIQKLVPLISSVLAEIELSSSDLSGVAYTAGPGLASALLVGAAVGCGIARGCGVPVLGVHHMEGHLLAPMLEDPDLGFPFLALLVSGGHTLLVDVHGLGRYRVLGESLDDAVGEAFDKTAKLLGLGYPGGPAIARAGGLGSTQRFRFPRPMTDRPGLDFSFSGLKTFALTTVKDNELDEQTIADVAWAFQDAAVDTLVIKTARALTQTRHKQFVVAGGVGANEELRKRLHTLAEEKGVRLFYPSPELCTDNGAMIAYAGGLRLLAGQRQESGFQVWPRWSLEDLNALEIQE